MEQERISGKTLPTVSILCRLLFVFALKNLLYFLYNCSIINITGKTSKTEEVKMVNISLDLQSESPIYIQLRNKIIEGIASKQLRPGDPLPSVRTFAQDLGVNMHTVNKAYQLLKQDGFIQIHRQKGVVINPEGMPTVDENYLANVRENLRPLISESVCRGMNEEELMKLIQEVYEEIQKGGEHDDLH